MIHRFIGTKTPFIMIKGKKSIHYVNPDQITSIRVLGDKVAIYLTEFQFSDGYGENEYFEITLEEFKEIFK